MQNKNWKSNERGGERGAQIPNKKGVGAGGPDKKSKN